MPARALLLALAAAAAPARGPAPAAPGPSDREAARLRAAGAPGLSAIRPAALSAHVRFLADDLLEGRLTGSRGEAIAQRYVASQLQAAGVEPAGEGGGWLQPVPLRAAHKDPARTSLAVSVAGGPEERLAPGADFALVSDLRTAEVDVAAPLVFAGWGITAPEYGHDDLAGVDLAGKIALVLFSAPLSDRPDFFPPTAHAVYSDVRAKLRRLADRGAAGALLVLTPEDEERAPWARIATSWQEDQMDWLDGDAPGGVPPAPPLRGIVRAAAVERVLERAGQAGGVAGLLRRAARGGGVPLPVVAHGRLSATFRAVASANVVGRLPGKDPRLAAEHVVFTAHLDHLGVGEPVDGDAIRNGALDNASGVAALIEIARAFAALPARPARSILFVAVTGEEKGLVGSDYFARHPTVPAAGIVADVNIDMILALRPLHDVVPIGAEHSTLASSVRDAAAALGLAVSADPRPRQVIFIRSDQYRFVQRGVPSLFVVPGSMDGAGRTEENAALRRAWLEARYHTPQDEWDPALDWEAMAQLARVDFLVGLAVASRPERPRWNPGDPFERLGAPRP